MRSPAARKDFPGLGSLSWGSPPSLSIAARMGRRQIRVTRPRKRISCVSAPAGRGASDEGKVFADREQGRPFELKFRKEKKRWAAAPTHPPATAQRDQVKFFRRTRPSPGRQWLPSRRGVRTPRGPSRRVRVPPPVVHADRSHPLG